MIQSYHENLLLHKISSTRQLFGNKAVTNSRIRNIEHVLVNRVLDDMTRDVTRYLFLAKRDMTRHITGDVTRDLS